MFKKANQNTTQMKKGSTTPQSRMLNWVIDETERLGRGTGISDTPNITSYIAAHGAVPFENKNNNQGNNARHFSHPTNIVLTTAI